MGKELTKSNTNRMIAGVCGGVAEHFNLDPTFVRVMWIVCSLFGAGVFAYLVCLVMLKDATGASFGN